MSNPVLTPEQIDTLEGCELDEAVARLCPACGKRKRRSEFWKDKNRKSGLRRRCKVCIRAANRDWYRRNKEHVSAQRAREKPWRSESFRARRKAWQIQTRYGLSSDDFAAMVEQQCGLCAICNEPPSSSQKGGTLHVDHCHDTNTIRGLLCNRCNVGLANFRENPAWLRQAAKYLDEQGAALKAVSSLPARTAS